MTVCACVYVPVYMYACSFLPAGQRAARAKQARAAWKVPASFFGPTNGHLAQVYFLQYTTRVGVRLACHAPSCAPNSRSILRPNLCPNLRPISRPNSLSAFVRPILRPISRSAFPRPNLHAPTRTRVLITLHKLRIPTFLASQDAQGSAPQRIQTPPRNHGATRTASRQRVAPHNTATPHRNPSHP